MSTKKILVFFLATIFITPVLASDINKVQQVTAPRPSSSVVKAEVAKPSQWDVAAYDLIKVVRSNIMARSDMTREHYLEREKLLSEKAQKLVELIMAELSKDRTAPGDKTAQNPATPPKTEGILSKLSKIFSWGDKQKTQPDINVKQPILTQGQTGKTYSMKEKTNFWAVSSPLLQGISKEIEKTDVSISNNLFELFKTIANAQPKIRSLAMIEYIDWKLISSLGYFRSEVPGLGQFDECHADPVLDRNITNYLRLMSGDSPQAQPKALYDLAEANMLVLHKFITCASARQVMELESSLISAINEATKIYSMANSGDVAGLKTALNVAIQNEKNIYTKPDIGKISKPDMSLQLKKLAVKQGDEAFGLLYGGLFNILFNLFDANKAVFSRSWNKLCEMAPWLAKEYQKDRPMYQMGLWAISYQDSTSYYVPLLPADVSKPLKCSAYTTSKADGFLTQYGEPIQWLAESYCLQSNPVSPPKMPLQFNSFFENFMSGTNLAFGQGDLVNAGRGMPLIANICGDGGGGSGAPAEFSCTITGVGPSSFSGGTTHKCAPNPAAVPHIPGGVSGYAPIAAPGGVPINQKNLPVDTVKLMAAQACSFEQGDTSPEEQKIYEPIDEDSVLGQAGFETDGEVESALKKASQQAKEDVIANKHNVENAAAQITGGQVGDWFAADSAFKHVAVADTKPLADFMNQNGYLAFFDRETNVIFVNPMALKNYSAAGMGKIIAHEVIHAYCENMALDTDSEHVITEEGGFSNEYFNGSHGYPNPSDGTNCTAKMAAIGMAGFSCGSSGADKAKGNPCGPTGYCGNPWGSEGGGSMEGGGNFSGSEDGCWAVMGSSCFGEGSGAAVNCEGGGLPAITPGYGITDPAPIDMYAKNPAMSGKMPPFLVEQLRQVKRK